MIYFSIEELGAEKADAKIIGAITALIENVLDPARKALGKPIIINSGYRSLEHNKKIGGAVNSQHCKGEAADIELGAQSKQENKLLFDYIKNNLEFDQLIDEKNLSWVHVSYRKGANRKQILSL